MIPHIFSFKSNIFSLGRGKIAKQKDSSKYVPEGVEGLIKYKGEVSKIIFKLIGGLKSSMGYLGSKNVINLRNKPKFVKITKAGFYESMVHSIDEVKKNSQYL